MKLIQTLTILFFVNFWSLGQSVERVMLHFNKSVYLPKDTVYFKAYLYSESTLSTDSLSKVLHITLLSKNGVVIEKQRLQLINGQTTGAFVIKNTQDTTLYYVRAFTNYQKNFGDSSLYIKPIVFCSNNYIFQKNDILPQNIHLSFEPQSGTLVEGLPSKINVLCTDFFGNPVRVSGEVIDSDKTVSAIFKTDTSGRDQFLFVPVANKTYRAQISTQNKEAIFSFFNINKNGNSLYTISDKTDTLNFRFYTNINVSLKRIFIETNEKTIQIAEDSTGRNVLKFSIPKYLFPVGRSTVLVEDKQGNVLSRYSFQNVISPKFKIQFDPKQRELNISTNNEMVQDISVSILNLPPTEQYLTYPATTTKPMSVSFQKEQGIKVRGRVSTENGVTYPNQDLIIMNLKTNDSFSVKTNGESTFSFEDNTLEDTLIYFVQGIKNNGKLLKVSVSKIDDLDSASINIPDDYQFKKKSIMPFAAIEVRNSNQDTLKTITLANVKIKGKAREKYIGEKSKMLNADYTIGKDEIIQRVGSGAARNLQELLTGRVPGLVSTGSGLKIRGSNSFQGDTPVLILVDGFPSDESIVFGNWQTIEKIEIVKNLAGAALYGTRSSGGIIAITTNNMRLSRSNTTPNQLSEGVLKIPAYSFSYSESYSNWYPNTSITKTKTATFPLNTINLPSDIYVHIEGITTAGVPFEWLEKVKIVPNSSK